MSAEEVTLKDERYLPISELDLRAVVRDLKAVISGLKAQDASTVVRGLTLSGINSAHPLIKELFEDALGCEVNLLNPVLMPRVTGFSLDDLLVKAGLARLIGLGLGFLPREQLLSCNLTEAFTSLETAAPSALAVELIIDAEAQSINSAMAPLDVDVTPLFSDGQRIDALDESLSTEESVKADEQIVVEDPGVSEVEEESPSLELDLELKEEVAVIDEQIVVEEPEVSELEEEWPSIKSIPGLELSEVLSGSEIPKTISTSSPVIDDSLDSSSLGELRFQDE